MQLLTLLIAFSFSPLLFGKPSKKVEMALHAARVQLKHDEVLTKSALPHAVLQKVQKFLQEHPEFVQSFIVQGDAEPLTADFRYKDRLQRHTMHKKELLDQLQLKNHANNINTIIRVPGEEGYFMRISGELHRDANALCTLGHRTGRRFSLFEKLERNALTLEEEQELDTYKTQNPKTVQTISQIAFYKMVEHAIAAHNIKTIRIPVTGLVHVPGRPRTVEDKNYVVVQQELRTCFSLWKHPELRKKVTKSQIADIKKVIHGTGLWDIKKNLFFCVSTGQLALVDFEQPNMSNSDRPPYLDDTRRAQLAQQGLVELRELLIHDHSEAFED